MRRGAIRIRIAGEQNGFTLPELLTAVSIFGILLLIAVLVLLSLLERWRVDAAAHQLAADLRLAHTRAVNQLTDWRVVLVPGVGDEEDGPDYYLVRLEGPHGPNGPEPDVQQVIKRHLPADVYVMDERIGGSGAPMRDDPDQEWCMGKENPCSAATRTLEFNPDGSMAAFIGPSGRIRVTVDGDPQRKLTFLSATSRIKLWP
ncbi:MAG: prepilin-type N-terminal cleavage/methylation domain-containing protein [Rubrobacteraceae bacterium]|uniref:pilus assembly FimT family protein n=1 Tax=Rubrobacter naiadicus TaxID=1392641 RepID=UPI00235F01BA|nr:prepilin-type N-terminal cleavage/methylation domain-containing protein [Rubrobacter naiadicus]MBX6764335.1 prepilin-type N-terminal cleavage/methylation domain-containing protein [Rubrobacteraceae bacterium]MCL6438554.1 prepilin-type N-terminal cleavage/methylation domain-containing protein [Rubrobacteraceae bacterium]